ncbi:MAG TPA: radical SAM protein [Thermoanaerobaculia bacterium]
MSPDASAYPSVRSLALDTLWFQVAGTLCNLECAHCFISCAPANHRHAMLGLDEVRGRLREAIPLGVKEYYFTGGEPFLHPDLFTMLEETLRQGPATVLTNGVLLTPERCRRLRALAEGSEYSLDLRVSIEGYTAETNDVIRGAGTFGRILAGIRNLADAGVNPVVTVSEACDEAATAAGRARFLDWMRGIGLSRPRLKILSLFRMGAEASRLRGYLPSETLAGRTLTAEETERLQCSSGRMVTARGVYVCPLLIDEPAAKMGERLAETLRPFPLAFAACYTCHEFGVTCRT